ncbi:MAG: hypothetical protein IPH78_14285 [Bacteroidetes bacterium]|nr:hypothetical protein [Bacteroidota bacterium]
MPLTFRVNGGLAGRIEHVNQNTFLGHTAGTNNSGVGNSFFGADAGFANTSGGNNTFMGNVSGNANTTGNFNTFTAPHRLQ